MNWLDILVVASVTMVIATAPVWVIDTVDRIVHARRSSGD